MGQIRIGTSGWNYDHWQDNFYPSDLNSDDWLTFYADHFNTVEINNTFYQLPKAETLRSWNNITGDDFLFAPKASRYTTHMKKLSDPKESTDKIFELFPELGESLGPILFQLPPNWSFDGEKLARFLEILPQEFRYVCEFRDQSWINDEAAEILRKYNCGFCIYDMENYQTPEYITSDLIYIRLHGPDPNHKYQGRYSDEALSYQAERIQHWAQEDYDVFLYFNNDMEGFAPQNALQIKEMLNR